MEDNIAVLSERGSGKESWSMQHERKTSCQYRLERAKEDLQAAM